MWRIHSVEKIIELNHKLWMFCIKSKILKWVVEKIKYIINFFLGDVAESHIKGFCFCDSAGFFERKIVALETSVSRLNCDFCE